jgi:hypothetical protein
VQHPHQARNGQAICNEQGDLGPLRLGGLEQSDQRGDSGDWRAVSVITLVSILISPEV